MTKRQSIDEWLGKARESTLHWQCRQCDYRLPDNEAGHCYMFKAAPEFPCGQFKDSNQ